MPLIPPAEPWATTEGGRRRKAQTRAKVKNDMLLLLMMMGEEDKLLQDQEGEKVKAGEHLSILTFVSKISIGRPSTSCYYCAL
jgi:hypothetical protein